LFESLIRIPKVIYEINTLKAVFYTGKDCTLLQHEVEFGGLDGKASKDFDLKYRVVRENWKITMNSRRRKEFSGKERFCGGLLEKRRYTSLI
jgi:hypothetical protein